MQPVLMLVFLSKQWMDFVIGTKISSNYIDFCLHSAQWTMSRIHSPVSTMCIHFVAPLVAHMTIEVLRYGRVLWPNSVLK
jgi:hypothetical protein